MRRSTEFDSVVRAGFRARAGRLVVHHAPELQPARGGGGDAAVVGFVVSKAVGNSVQRHSVSRRLRAQVAGRLESLPAGSGTVVRALPGSASATSADLARDLQRALARLSLATADRPSETATTR